MTRALCAAAILLAFAAPAQAQTVTLVCNKNFEKARRVINVDLAQHTVTVTNKSPQAFPARIDDRYVIWTDPFADGLIDNRLERATGHLDWKRPDRNMGWLAGGSCERIAKPVL